jgi:hypothetical protein
MQAVLLLTLVLVIVVVIFLVTTKRAEPYAASCSMIPFVQCPVPYTFTRQYTLDEWNTAFCKNATTAEECCQILTKTMQNNCEIAKRKAGVDEGKKYEEATAASLQSYKPPACTYGSPVDEGTIWVDNYEYYLKSKSCIQPVCNPGFIPTSHIAAPQRTMVLEHDPVYIKYEIIDKCSPSADLIQKTCEDKRSLFVNASKADQDFSVNQCKSKQW